MTNTTTIVNSQQLRFVNRTLYSSTPNTFDNRLYPHVEFQDRDIVPYCQKVQQNDSLWFQFRTSFDDFNINLVDSDFNKTSLSAGSPIYSYEIEDGTTVYIYNCDIPVSSLTGIYYVEMYFNTENKRTVFWSEQFDVQAEHENTLLLKFGGNSGTSDGFRWASVPLEIDRYQYLRIEARMIEGIPDDQKSTYDDSDIELTTLDSNPIRIDTLDIKLIPYYLHEKINLALGHDEFYVNDELYNLDESFELTSFKDQLTRTGSIPLRKVVYENNEIYEDLEGETIVLAQELRTTGLETRTTGLEDRTINI